MNISKGLPLPNTIFVAGGIASGKDTVVDQLVAQCGFRKVHIVEPYKRQVAAELGVPYEEFEARNDEFREYLQRGAIERRAANPNCMIDLFDEMRRRSSERMAVTGARFINEAQYAIERGFLVVRLNVVREERLRRALRRALSKLGNYTAEDVLRLQAEIESRFDHPTEAEVPLMPVHLDLDGTYQPEAYPTIISAGYVKLLGYKVSEFMRIAA